MSPSDATGWWFSDLSVQELSGERLANALFGPAADLPNQTVGYRGQKSASFTSSLDGSHVLLSLKTQFQSREPEVK